MHANVRSGVILVILGCIATSRAAAGDSGPIRNPGFESFLEGWTRHVYGPDPVMAADDQVKHEGKQSLRIDATEAADIAIGQEIRVKPNHFYRLSGWVKTRGLKPADAPVFGTFQIQSPGGKHILVSGTNHQGDTDWTQAILPFQAPASGLVRVSVFFAGFGKATGTAWFDDLKLEEVNLADVPIKITHTLLYSEPISPLQYGQFVEYLCDLVPSMWAEKLYDGSFEGLSPYKFYYLKETDFREKPWHPYGATNRAEYSLDPKNPVSGKVSQKIAVAEGAPCTVGIAQDGIAVDKDIPCVFTCYLRQDGVTRSVGLKVLGEGKELAAAEFSPTAEWKKYRVRLVFTTTNSQATLAVTFQGPGTLWLDNASLMPEKTIGGWRSDVIDAVKALKPGVIRFGGSALDDANLGEFDWRDTIGDLDKRKPFRAWGGLQPTGPGLEEIVQFCRHVSAEPLLCVRVSKKDPKDAADQVEYFNGGPQTSMGKLRVANGHPKPYGVKYWQIGNERAGADYERRLPVFCRAMKAVDPTIQLLSSYPTPGVLEKAGKDLDFVCPHHYAIADLAGAENDLGTIQAMIKKLSPQRTIKVGVTEWNTTAGDIGPRRAMLWTLENALACSRYHNLLHRHGDLVTIANRSNLSNSFCSGIIQTDNHRLYKTPTYYAQELYANRAGQKALAVDCGNLPANLAPDISATLDGAGKTLTLFAVNKGPTELSRPLDFTAFFTDSRKLTAWTLADTQHAGEPDVANSFDNPKRIVPRQSTQNADLGRCLYRFPPYSLTVIQVAVAKVDR